MYSWEIGEFIKNRNGKIGGDDLLKIIDPKENPQIQKITYQPSNNTYYMKDNENNEFYFQAIPYEEAKQKGLVKTKEKQKI